MLEGKQLMDKLYCQADLFRVHMRNRQYPEAKACYDRTRDALVFLEADEQTRKEFFGERGERGACISRGLFDEGQVQLAYEKVIFAREQEGDSRCAGCPLRGR